MASFSTNLSDWARRARDHDVVPRRLPTYIDDFQIIREIGRGGMGVVYEAQQTNPSRRVALKVVHSAGFLPDDRQVRALRKEIRVLASLTHPSIATVYYAGVEATTQMPYFVMELVRGESLSDHVAALPRRARLKVFCRIVRTVAYAHERGVIHLDLKPSNIIIQPDGTPKVLDFGLAQFLRDDGLCELSVTLINAGTIQYMAPERIVGHPRDALTTYADIYALGVMLYELLADRHPFAHTDGYRKQLEDAIVESRPQPPSKHSLRVSRQLDAVALTAMDKHPTSRYPSAHALAYDVENYLAGRPVTARRAGAWYTALRWGARHKPTVGVMIVAAIFLTFVTQWRLTEARQRALETANRFCQLADQARVRGNYGSALWISEQCLVMQRKLFGPDTAEVLVKEIDRAELARELGRFDDARSILNSVLSRVSKSSHLYGSAMLALAKLLFITGEHIQAIDAGRKAVAILKDHPEQSIAYSKSLTVLANLHRAVGELEIGMGYAKQAVAFTTAHFPTIDRARIGCLRTLAVFKMDSGDLQGARQILDKIPIAVISQDSGDTADTYSQLGGLLWTIGDYQGAELFIRQAITVNDKLSNMRYAPDNYRRVLLYNMLGVCLRDQCRFDEASVALDEAQRAGERLFESENTWTINMTVNRARLFYMRGDYSKAHALIAPALKARRHAQGSASPAVAEAAMVLGSVLTEMDRLDEAEPLLREALTIRRNVYASDHWSVAEAQSSLAAWMIHRGESDKAMSLLCDSLAKLKAKLNPDHKFIRQTRDRLARASLSDTDCPGDSAP